MCLTICSVAIGAAHALERGCNRVAIFDFDAHHGNGTEEIVRALPGKDKVLFISIHLEDTDHTEVEDNYTFYPASGKTSSILSRNPIINIPITPNWRCPQSDPSVAGAVAAQKASSRSRRAPRCQHKHQLISHQTFLNTSTKNPKPQPVTSRNDDNGSGGGGSQPGDNSSGAMRVAVCCFLLLFGVWMCARSHSSHPHRQAKALRLLLL